MSSSTSSVTQNFAFFGATGGCALAALTRTLKSSSPYHVNALARTPSKLTNLLLEKGVSQSLIDQRLTIIAGDVKNADSVRSTLTVSDSGNGELRIVDGIISGIGSTPVLRWHIKPFTIADPNICKSAIDMILSSLSVLQDTEKDTQKGPQRPLLAVVSTTGVSTRSRDVPLLFYGLYHWLLAVPHEDKREMESTLVASGQRMVTVRPSLLMDGEAKDTSRIRVGWELPPEWDARSQQTGAIPGPAVGYTITRESVGNWIFVNLIEGAESSRKQWEGRMVSLTE